MPAGAVSLIGLVNPVVGTTLGVAIAGEAFGRLQALGVVLVLGGVVAGQPGTARLGTPVGWTSGCAVRVAAPRRRVPALLADRARGASGSGP